MVTKSTASWSDSEVIDHYYNHVTSMLAATFRPDEMYFNGDTMKRSYWVTICSGIARTNKDHWQVAPLRSETKSFSSGPKDDLPFPEFPKSISIGAMEADGISDGIAQMSNTEYQAEADYQVKATLVETTQHHSFCMTEEGYMALAPDTTRPGDILCALYGGCTPFVLRPVQWTTPINVEGAIGVSSQGDDFMELIGPAYAYGFMDSLPQQWLEEGIRKERRFILV